MKKIALLRFAKALVLSVIGVILTAAVLLTVARAMTPVLNHNRSFFQAWGSRAFHQPIQVGRVTVGWRGFNPVMDFSDVTVLDPEGHRSLLHVDQLSISINLFYSLLKWELLPGHLAIVGTDFNVVQNQKGEFSVKGMVGEPGSQVMSDMGRVKGIALWMLTQSDVSIDNANVSVHRKGGQRLQVQGLRLKVSNNGLKHTISGVASLAQSVPTHLRFVLNLHDVDLDPDEWSADLYVAAKHVVLTQWMDDQFVQPYFQDLSVTQGRANIQAWSTWKKGHCASVQTLVQGEDIALAVHPKDEKEAKKKKQEVSQRLWVNRLSANVSWQKEPSGWSISADHLNFRLNGKSWPEHRFGMRAIQIDDKTTKVLLSARFVRLEDIQVFAGQSVFWPAKWRQAYQQLKPRGDVRDLVFEYTRTRDQSLDYRLSARFKHLGVSPWSVVPGVTGLTGSFSMTPGKGNLQLDGRASQLESANLLKHHVLLDQFHLKANWQKEASNWSLRVPEFSVKDDHLLAAGHFEWDGSDAAPPKLDLSASFELPKAEYLKTFLPKKAYAPDLLDWFDQAFTVGSLTNGKLIFRGAPSDFPFKNRLGAFSLSAKANNMTLHYAPAWPPIQHLNAELNVDNQNLKVVSEKAEVMGSSLNHLKVSIPDLSNPILTATGHSEGDLNKGFRFLKAAPLDIAEHLDGLVAKGAMALNLKVVVPFKAALGEVAAEGDVLVQQGRLQHRLWDTPLTDINGLFHFSDSALTAKEVTAKFYEQPLRVNVSTRKDQADHSIVQFDANGRLKLSMLHKEHSALLDKVQGVMPYHAEAEFASGGTNPGAKLIVTSNLKGVSVDLPAPYSKTAVQIRPFRLQAVSGHHVINMNYGDVALQWLSQAAGWSIHIKDPMLQGTIMMPTNKKNTWYAHFSRLYWKTEPLPAQQNKQHVVKTQSHSAYDPHLIPPFVIVCDDCRYGQFSLGQVELATQPMPSGVLIKQLKIAAPLFSVSASGAWSQVGSDQWTTLNGRFDATDMGKLLDDGQVTQALVGGKGNAHFNVRWGGAPSDFAVANLNGDAAMQFKDGRIVQLSQDAESDLGLGRLLNLLSLQSLPEHLALNFENQKEGFPFKVLEGDFKIKNGEVKTQNMSLVGDIAWVRIQGIMDFVQRKYDLDLNVIPNVTSTFPLIATVLGGPVAGAITWAANKVLARQIGKAAQFDYHVTGTWKKPNVIELPQPAATRSI